MNIKKQYRRLCQKTIHKGTQDATKELLDRYCNYRYAKKTQNMEKEKEMFILKIIKNITLWLLLLIVMTIGGTLVLKIFDLILKLEYENIWISGFKVGFVAWIGMLMNEYYHFIKNKKEN